jgi:hypothetical protein
VLFGAVIVDEVPYDIAGELIDAGVHRQPFIDDFSPEGSLELLVHDTRYRSSLGTMPMMASSLLSSRRRMRLVSNAQAH